MQCLKTIPFLLMLFLLGGCASTYNVTTHRDELIFISDEKEQQIGDNLAKQVKEKFKLEEDPLLQKRVEDVGAKIVAVSDRKSVSYHFALLTDEEDTVNAFALPGGYVFVFKGLLDKIESDDELASVLAHEVAHIVARHSVKRMQASLGTTILRLAISRAAADNATRAMANEALNMLMLSYSREDEILADEVSIKYAKLAGYNPEGAVTFLNRLMEIQKKAPVRRYSPYRTHPYLSERLSLVREQVYGKMNFRDYINIGNETLPARKQ